MERSIISLHIGQGGVQMGQAIWELLTSEHEFSPTGTALNPDKVAEDITFRAFYHLTEANQYVPRVLFVDLEPTCIDEIRVGPYKQLFHPDQLINGLEDAANNFSRGYFTQGKSIMVPYMNSLRKQAEASDSLQGFVVGVTMGGGTGAGFGSLVMEHLSANYPKTAKLQLFVNPSPNLVTCIVEPYNSILATHYQFEHSDVSFMVDNESMYNICRDNLSIFSPTYTHINRIVAQLWSALTVSFRFEGAANTDLVALQTNLVPYPRIHFPIISYAPVINRARANHQSLSVPEITRAVFEPGNQLVSLDANNGRFMAVSLLYRGDVSMMNVYKTLAGIKANGMNFVDWCPTGFKVGINSMPPTVTVSSRLAPVSRNVTMLTNNTSIGVIWERINVKATTLFSKRAFVHSFVGDGMEEGEISDAIENVNALVKDYHECGNGVGGGDADADADADLLGDSASPPPIYNDDPPEDSE